MRDLTAPSVIIISKGPKNPFTAVRSGPPLFLIDFFSQNLRVPMIKESKQGSPFITKVYDTLAIILIDSLS